MLAVGVLGTGLSLWAHFDGHHQGVFLRVWSQRVFVRTAGLLAFHTSALPARRIGLLATVRLLARAAAGAPA